MTSKIYLSQSALEHNVHFIRQLIGPRVIFSSVIKGNAYGHGVSSFIPMAEACDVNHFSVFSADEAMIASKSLSKSSTLMIMGHMDLASIEWAIEKDYEFFVFEQDRLEKVITIAQKMDKKAKIHLELETGMNRTGLEKKKLPEIAEKINGAYGHLDIKGLCTHYAGAESVANYYRIVKQRKRFDRMSNILRREGIIPKYRHTACSAASLRFNSSHMDLVRLGILQYGFFPSPETMIEYMNRKKSRDYPLKRIISWTSQVMHTKKVKAGEYVGYGTSYLATNDSEIAIIPVGYSNGFSRDLSNQGRVLIHGQRVSVVGMVNMNMMAIDVSNIENVKKRDEVVLIGRQGDLEISVASFAEYSRQANYEMLVRLPRDIPRSVVD